MDGIVGDSNNLVVVACANDSPSAGTNLDVKLPCFITIPVKASYSTSMADIFVVI